MFFEAVARNWWMFLIRGILAILFGVVAWVWPDLTVTALVILFGAYALVDGAFAIIAAITAGGEGRWLPLLLAGLAGIVIGIVTFVWPDITALALLLIIAAWAIVLGVLQIVAAIQLRRLIEGEWVLVLSGSLAIIFGLVVALAFRLRSLRESMQR